MAKDFRIAVGGRADELIGDGKTEHAARELLLGSMARMSRQMDSASSGSLM